MSENIYERVVELLRSGREGVLATIISVDGSAPQKSGAKFLVAEDGETFGTIGGLHLERIIAKEVPKVLSERRPKRLRFTLDIASARNAGLICGGDVEVYLEPLLRDPRLIVIGAGHIGRPLARMARWTDFEVIVLDAAGSDLTEETLPEANRIVLADDASAFDGLPVDGSTFIVIVTSGHKRDEEYLERALRTKACYVGMIGSRAKRDHSMGLLREMGVAETDLARVHSPVGLDIGSVTPAEIAVSILAEMIALRRGKGPGPYPSLTPGPRP
jgi:xanthine dehydrogenase accessory factor